MGKNTAFSATIEEHAKDGPPVLMEYTASHYDPDSWDGKAFRVPKKGLYCFHVSFMRDSQMGSDGKFGTTDDTKIEILVEDVAVAAAWAGESTVARQTASVTIVLPLEEGKVVTTQDYVAPEAKDKFRRFKNCVFTGYRVAKIK